jgi:hypothetical protein
MPQQSDTICRTGFALVKRPNFSAQAGRIGKQLYYDSPKTPSCVVKTDAELRRMTRLLVLPLLHQKQESQILMRQIVAKL